MRTKMSDESPLDRKEIERRAAAAGMTLAEFIAEIIKYQLDKEQNVSLTALEAATKEIHRLNVVVNVLEAAAKRDVAELEQLNERVVFLATENTVKDKLIRDKNQIIRELCVWLDSEFRFDTWPPESPGRQLWDRAQATIDVT